MTQAGARILEEAEQLPPRSVPKLADRIVERLIGDIPPEVAAAEVVEVRRRIAEVESGEVSLIPRAGLGWSRTTAIKR